MSSKPAPDRLIAYAVPPDSPSLVRLPLVRVYCDESSQTGHRFKVWGGVWIPDAEEPALRAAIEQVRSDAGWQKRGEFKWVKLSGSSCHPAYVKLIDAFFSAKCAFAAIVVDSLNPGPNRGEDAELDHYKSLYWLLSKRTNTRHRYRVVLDDRTDREKDRLSELRDVLNATARRDLRYPGTCFREIIARKSHDDDVLQLADVLIGAVAYHRNGRHLIPGASASKCYAAQYIAAHAGFRDAVICHTRKAEKKFNVWCWDPNA